jgi:hypothetical protein
VCGADSSGVNVIIQQAFLNNCVLLYLDFLIASFHNLDRKACPIAVFGLGRRGPHDERNPNLIDTHFVIKCKIFEANTFPPALTKLFPTAAFPTRTTLNKIL